MRKITYSEAINEALVQEMERDKNIFVYGIGVPDPKRIFGTTNHLLERFGSERCFDTPLSEDAMTGFGLGSAVNGLRPVHVHARADFVLLAMNQIINMISSYRYSSGGNLNIPVVIRVIVGRGWGQTFQHSKSLHSFFSHIPGLKVVLPTTPADAKGLLISAIRDDNPVIFFEHRWLYWGEDYVPEEPFTVPIGKANILREGKDITIIGTSWMNVEALRASEFMMEKQGVSVEVIDPRTTSPLDVSTIVESVKKTGHCIVLDNDWLDCGFSAEVAALVSERCFDELKSPVRRIGFAFSHCPSTRPLENCFYPNAANIIRVAEELFNLPASELSGEEFYSYENKFRGPF